MSYLIVGGGIAGLFTAYSLYKKYGTTDILIIEQHKYLGGRIRTLHSSKYTLEIGAGIILENHKNVLKLVHELGLDSDLSLYKSIKYYMDDTKIVNVNKDGFIEIVKDLKKNLDTKLAMSYTLYHYIERQCGIEIADDLKNQFGYSSDFYEQNAVDGINMLLRDTNTSFYKLNNGYDQIIYKLRDYLIDRGIKIQLETSCIDINKYENKYECLLNNKKVIVDSVVLAIPQHALCKINYLSSITKNLLNTVVPKSLMRIYLFFPLNNNKCWFDSLQGVTVTNTILNQIIPINKKEGILMVYLIDNSATIFNYLKLNYILESEVMFHLRRTFKGVIIPNPIKIHSKYWQRATHMWRPLIYSEILNKKIIQPIDSDKIYIVGEAYSMQQQWVEGALMSVNNLMDLI